jgi:hypothetical protein
MRKKLVVAFALAILPSLLVVTASSAARCTVTGTPGNDVITGTAGKDVICGLAGNDTINGLGGDDTLEGGDGNDKLGGGPGADTLNGGNGGDTVSYAASNAPLHVNLATHRATGEGTDTLTGIDNAVGSSHPDTLVGNVYANNLSGGGGGDQVHGGSGDDHLTGGNGADRLFGEPNDDSLDGGPGADYLDGGTGDNVCVNGDGDQLANDCDSSPPVLAGLTISPTTMDTSSGPQRVTVDVHATDEIAGVRSAAISVVGPGGATIDSFSYSQIAGNSNNGVWRIAFTVPRYAPQGTWRIGHIQIEDRAGNELRANTVNGKLLGLPATFEQAGPGDDTAPQLTSFSLSPASVDTSGGPQQITVNVDATDDVSGIREVQLAIGAPNLSNPINGFDTTQTSGDANSGSWTITFDVPQYSPQGLWHVGVRLLDNAGNAREIYGTSGTILGVPNTFQQTGAGDSEAPKILGLSISPTTIDTSSAPRLVTLNIHATDLAGVQTFFPGVIGPGSARVIGFNQELISGDIHDGVWALSFWVPKYAPQGTWHIYQLIADDVVGNEGSISEAELKAAGFPTTFCNGPACGSG